MQIIISNASDEPIYRQIANQVRDMILSGELDEGQPLPSIRGLARDLRISVITTNRAYEELEAEGFIQSVPGKGSFVSEQNSELLHEKRLRVLEEHVAGTVAEARRLSLSLDELIDMVRFLYEEEPK